MHGQCRWCHHTTTPYHYFLPSARLWEHMGLGIALYDLNVKENRLQHFRGHTLKVMDTHVGLCTAISREGSSPRKTLTSMATLAVIQRAAAEKHGHEYTSVCECARWKDTHVHLWMHEHKRTCISELISTKTHAFVNTQVQTHVHILGYTCRNTDGSHVHIQVCAARAHTQ